MHYCTVVDDVDDDREMRVCEDHLELVPNTDSSEHVTDGTLDSSQNCVSLLLL